MMTDSTAEMLAYAVRREGYSSVEAKAVKQIDTSRNMDHLVFRDIVDRSFDKSTDSVRHTHTSTNRHIPALLLYVFVRNGQCQDLSFSAFL